jgi:hypothetical protein
MGVLYIWMIVKHRYIMVYIYYSMFVMTLWHLFGFFQDSKLCIQHADFASLGFGRWLDWLASPVSDSHHDRVFWAQSISSKSSHPWKKSILKLRHAYLPLAINTVSPGHFFHFFNEDLFWLAEYPEFSEREKAFSSLLGIKWQQE